MVALSYMELNEESSILPRECGPWFPMPDSPGCCWMLQYQNVSLLLQLADLSAIHSVALLLRRLREAEDGAGDLTIHTQFGRHWFVL